MWDNKQQKNDPGLDPALVVKRFLPDHRQVSIRWLTGTILTGITSCLLMGIALFAALDEQQRLVTPPQWFTPTNLPQTQNSDTNGHKRDRIAQTHARQSFDSKRQFELSILQKKGDQKVIQTQNFEWIRMALAEERPQKYSYPKFDALNIFATDSKNQTAPPQDTGEIYGAKVETKITLRNHNFILDQVNFDGADTLTEDEVQQELQKAGFTLEKNHELLSILTLVDPLKLEDLSSSSQFTDTPEVRIIQENVTVSSQNHRIDLTKNYAEDIIPIHKKQKIIEAFRETNYTKEQIEQVAKTLAFFNHSETLKAGSLLRIGIVTQAGEEDHLVRASIYQGMYHVLTVALNDEGQFVESTEPQMSQALKTAFQNGIPHSYVNTTQLPTVYDALYNAILSHNMSQSLSQRIIRLLATNVDMKSRITPTDQLEIFYAVPQQSEIEKNNKETLNGQKSQKAKEYPTNADPEIRYISATFGNATYKYYRYQSKDGSVDYYDSEGKSSKPFLLRKPTPNGIFGSPFGPRKHPILGYVRMHTGVDWVAPKGSPIIAVGDGIVIKMGVSGGYGNHTEIQHPNGYISSYSHQSRYAPDIKPGVKVRQGQIIGYVGTTGMATGPHCHFEIIVNGVKVDPMRIRIPDSKTLTNQDLQAFLREKNNIDSLLNSPMKPSEDTS
ncbi:peptidase M23 [Bartonella henselae]|uniref:Peptidase, M23/M37 family n=4 Tax=Bartonella TaxID=773 RepID=X5MGI8_BARHN|nr:M23 family metallopeptidase [Bartonella henselae]MDM9996877.1 M23 family metallopeptidase [Bartonella henselae]OLL50517.1 peptidase M23 [Bartonella henselae]OLL51404.1 peptidase M23 [Bartonella henselae]OLL52467.1 peptidase M23 [Bartonella henselae]OLL57273.1 peptidase M23 [Bartonella henselae]